MLTSISPLGERARGNRFWLSTTAYAVGSIAGGVTIGTVLGAAGSLVDPPDAVAYGALAAVAVAGAVLDRAGRLPTRRRQVDERWLSTYRGWVYGLGYGFQLGLGVATIVTASITYVALAAAFLTASPAGGAVVGAAFGAGRAVPLLANARVRTTEDLAALHRRVDAAARPVATATLAAQAALAVAAVALLGASA